LKSKISWPNSLFVCRTALLIWFIGRKLASAIILPTSPDVIKKYPGNIRFWFNFPLDCRFSWLQVKNVLITSYQFQ
jgi:hypothetical protein